jgi:hypothetical protein
MIAPAPAGMLRRDSLEHTMSIISPRPCRFIACMATLLIVASPARPQSVDADSLINRADSLLNAGAPAEAVDLAEEALDEAAGSRHARITLGRSYFALGQWGDACDAFEALVKRDSADILAHYYLGRSLRELGTTKAWLLRKGDWRRSREAFFWVFRHDSTFRDAFYQYALLLDYDDDHPGAIAAGHTQVRLRSDLTDAKLGLYTLYRRFILRQPGEAVTWLQSQKTSLARFFLAEAYRREEKLDEAEKILRDMEADHSLPLVTPLYLTLARIAAMRNQPELSKLYFINAVNAIATNLAADLVFEDLKYLATDSEYDAYRRLTTPDEKVLFFKSFWDRRNPAAVGVENSRIGEHYLRLVRAEKEYEYTGFRNRFTNPDEFRELSFPRTYALNQEFNDKGLIYIRHGAPDNIVRSMQMLDAAETWVYEATDREPRRMMHFAKRNTIANYWRLMPYPKDTALISDLQTFDVRFRDLLGNNPSARERMTEDVKRQSQETVKAALSTEEHTWEADMKPFGVPVSVDAFRSTDDRTLVDISYALPLANLAHGLPEGEQHMPSEVALAIRTESGYDLVAKCDTLPLSPPKMENGMFIGLYRFLLPPGSYALAFHAKSLRGNSFGSWKGTKRIAAHTPTLSLSDIEFLLPSTSASTLEIDGVKVIPSPLYAYSLDKPLMVYFHAYNLVKDMFGNTATEARYYMTPLQNGAPSLRFDPENPPEDVVELETKRRDGKESTSANFASLNVRDLSPGLYQLTVVLTDRKQFSTVVGSKSVILISPP